VKLTTTRSALRQRLASLTDADLQAECLALILRRKEAVGTEDFRGASEVTQICWEECVERKRMEIFVTATDEAKEEMRRRKALNALPSQQSSLGAGKGTGPAAGNR
jgi:hypothetical protein